MKNFVRVIWEVIIMEKNRRFKLIALILAFSIGLLANSAVLAQNDDVTNKEQYLIISGRMYDIWEENDINPGTALGGEELSKSEFLEMQGEIYDVLKKYGIEPLELIMNKCLGRGWHMGGMMGGGWNWKMMGNNSTSTD
ncbi:hypothetical protein C4569_01320 [Candidatus Parcubacteria bacterium]|nr:MAG: hypothetical protein C4569_01320 [Candidatus Parcubacteria bacterium]